MKLTRRIKKRKAPVVVEQPRQPELTPETAYQGGKGWPSDRPIEGIIEAYKSFSRLLATTTDEGPYRKWVELEVTAHRANLRMRGEDIEAIDKEVQIKLSENNS